MRGFAFSTLLSSCVTCSGHASEVCIDRPSFSASVPRSSKLLLVAAAAPPSWWRLPLRLRCRLIELAGRRVPRDDDDLDDVSHVITTTSAGSTMMQSFCGHSANLAATRGRLVVALVDERAVQADARLDGGRGACP
jgi:hypothetical protein